MVVFLCIIELRVREIVKQLGDPIISEHTITLHFDRYIYSRNYFGWREEIEELLDIVPSRSA